MSIFVSSPSSTSRHGVFGIERRPPLLARGIGTGVCALVGQFDWGPDSVLVTPGDTGELLDQFAPDGFSRSTSGMRALTGVTFPALRIVRVLGTAKAKAQIPLIDSTPSTVTVCIPIAKYYGTGGNGITITVSNATDADPNHFNAVVAKSNAFGTTSDALYENLNYSGVGTAKPFDVTNSKLLGSVTAGVAGRPDNGVYILAGGANGTIDSTAYIGTPGGNDKGISLLEGDQTIRVVYVDDCGDALRSAVNEGLEAHGILTKDRLVITCGNKGLSDTAAVAQIDTINTDRAANPDSWVGIYDMEGNLVEVPPAQFLAAVITKVSPSTSPAWKATEIGEMLTTIQYLVSPRGSASIELITNAGGIALIKEDDGSFRFEAGILTDGSLITTRRMKDYIVLSLGKGALRQFVDAPNITEVVDEEIALIDNFLLELKNNKKKDPYHLPIIVDYKLDNIQAATSPSDIALGKRYLPFMVQTASDMSQIFLMATIGPSVVITEQAA